MTPRQGQPAQPDRRGLLKGAAAAGLAAALDPGSLGAAAPPRRGLIKGENDKLGTTDWPFSDSHSTSFVALSSSAA
jgi:hypothetical protein